MTFDRTKYEWEYAPPADELVTNWTADPPDARQIESFFLHELCESSEHEYFLAVSDLFFDVIEKQPSVEQISSLSIMGLRLLTAATLAETVEDELKDHFQTSLENFAKLFRSYLDPENCPDEIDDRKLTHVRIYSLALSAAVMGDIPLAFLICRSDDRVCCMNPDCETFQEELSCPACDSYIVPYDQHRIR